MDSPYRWSASVGEESMIVRVLVVYLLCAAAGRAGRARGRGATRPFRQVRGTQGAARGYFAPRPPHYAFLGLPYARAPAPAHRFKAPETPPTWDGIFEATHRVKCPQDMSGDENCLVLNIFTPEHAAKLPVVVLVHDGDFQTGQGTIQPPERFLSQGIVVVSFNYRIGLLGFLCLGTTEAPGNAGLKDQVAALYWVQRNIAKFGGNPADVTLYGIGSGAAAVHLLLLSGLTEGLFSKVVLESGSALSPLSLSYEPLVTALKAAVELGYEGTEDLKELVDFFNGVPPRKLTNISEIFLPCIETTYDDDLSLIDWDPMEVLKKGSYQQVPILVAYSSLDGMSVVKKNLDKFQDIPEDFGDLLPNNLKFEDQSTRQKIAQFVKEFYFDDTNDIQQSYADYFHDVLVEFPIVKSTILYAAQSSQPVYLFKFATSGEAYEKMIDYVFANEDLGEHETVAEKLMTLLCNFIKIGDPTPITTSLIPLIWQPVGEDTSGQLNVRTTALLVYDKTLAMTTTDTNQRLTFWDHVYGNFYRPQTSIHNDYN